MVGFEGAVPHPMSVAGVAGVVLSAVAMAGMAAMLAAMAAAAAQRPSLRMMCLQLTMIDAGLARPFTLTWGKCDEHVNRMRKPAYAGFRTRRPGGCMTETPIRPLDQATMATYRRLAAGQGGTDAEIRTLQSAGLVEPAPLGVALRDPRAASHARMAAAMDQLTQATEMLRGAMAVVEQVPALEALHHHYDVTRFFGGQASEFLGTRAEMNDRLLEVSELAESEFWAAQPGAPVDRDPEIVALGTRRSVRALERGIHVRTLYNRLVAEHGQAREAAEAVIDAGGEARALPPVFPRMVIIDAKHLFIDNLVGPGDRDCGWHVTDPAAVAWARVVFQHAWDRATAWADLSAQTRAEVATERQRQILSLLAGGQTQGQVGARLAISERTVANELAALKQALGMATSYQVMAWWGARREGRA